MGDSRRLDVGDETVSTCGSTSTLGSKDPIAILGEGEWESNTTVFGGLLFCFGGRRKGRMSELGLVVAIPNIDVVFPCLYGGWSQSE